MLLFDPAGMEVVKESPIAMLLRVDEKHPLAVGDLQTAAQYVHDDNTPDDECEYSLLVSQLWCTPGSKLVGPVAWAAEDPVEMKFAPLWVAPTDMSGERVLMQMIAAADLEDTPVLIELGPGNWDKEPHSILQGMIMNAYLDLYSGQGMILSYAVGDEYGVKLAQIKELGYVEDNQPVIPMRYRKRVLPEGLTAEMLQKMGIELPKGFGGAPAEAVGSGEPGGGETPLVEPAPVGAEVVPNATGAASVEEIPPVGAAPVGDGATIPAGT